MTAKKDKHQLIHVTVEEVDRQAALNLAKIQKDPLLDDLRIKFLQAAKDDHLEPKAKLYQLRKYADAISNLAGKHAACRHGCSHCCNISVGISKTEAESISRATKRKLTKPKEDVPDMASLEQWHGVPCPFLARGKCSIYEDRPIVCRLLLNIADTEYFCSLDVPAAESHVTSLDLRQLENAFMVAFSHDQWADIRVFFPNGKKA
ncbi:YkgJ family cysteine cluster protein [Pseudomonas aeruginosa]